MLMQHVDPLMEAGWMLRCNSRLRALLLLDESEGPTPVGRIGGPHKCLISPGVYAMLVTSMLADGPGVCPSEPIP